MDFKLQFNNKIFHFFRLFGVLFLSVILVACSGFTSIENFTDELLPADDMMQGPGVMSGDKGGFYATGSPEKAKPQTVTRPASKSVSNMDLNETSQVLDDKIRQLQRDQMELELLKREVDKKLNN